LGQGLVVEELSGTERERHTDSADDPEDEGSASVDVQDLFLSLPSEHPRISCILLVSFVFELYHCQGLD
jgi:hypothetical protein